MSSSPERGPYAQVLAAIHPIPMCYNSLVVMWAPVGATFHSHRYGTETAVLTDKDNEEQSEECEHDEPRLAFLRLLLTTITGLVTLPLTPTSAATNPEIKKTTKVSSNKKLYFRTSYARSVATLGSLSSRRNAAGLCARSVARKEPR